MYKYFIKTDVTAELQIEKLRKQFGTQYFLDGKYKGETGIFVCHDLTTKVYADPVPSKEHTLATFFAPLVDTQKFLESVIVPSIHKKIVVVTLNGIILEIIPATFEPRVILFDLTDTPLCGQVKENPFPEGTLYGKMAFDLYDLFAVKNENISMSDIRIKKFIIEIIKKSYFINVDLINCLQLISGQDIEPLVMAGLGMYSGDDVKKN